MVIYELDDDPVVVMGEFLKRVMSGAMSLGEWLDLGSIALNGWKPRGDRVAAGS